MPESSLLETTAEVAVSFAGFTGILLVLASRDGRFSAADSVGIRVIVLASVGPVFYAAMPLVLHTLGLSGMTLWRTSSAIAGVAILGLTAYLIPYLSAVPIADRPRPTSLRVVMPWLLTALAFAIHLFNALGWPRTPAGGPYVLSVWLVIAIAAGSFARLIFHRVL